MIMQKEWEIIFKSKAILYRIFSSLKWSNGYRDCLKNI